MSSIHSAAESKTNRFLPSLRALLWELVSTSNESRSYVVGMKTILEAAK